jgi:glycosyltransferase involved in cell wall biosynthesis
MSAPGIDMGDARPPGVSVIVCTYNRPAMAGRALKSVLAQDTDDYEVIVVDDGSDPPFDASVGDGDRVRVVRTPHGGPGAARAAGLAAARGTFVAYCDDDDVWTADHLRVLQGYLHSHPDVALVYADSAWPRPESPADVPYSFDFDPFALGLTNYIFATDVMHRVDAARKVGGFDPRLQAYEDWDLWLRLSAGHRIRHLPVVLAARHWHPDCVSAREYWDDWKRVYRRHLARLGRTEACWLSRRTVVPFDPQTWHGDHRQLVWQGIFRAEDGYGAVGRRLLHALHRQGVDITLAPFGQQPARGFERFAKPLADWSRLAFYYDYRFGPAMLPAERIIEYHMAESTRVPQPRIEEINAATALLFVPCHQNVRVFRDCGVRIPIDVLPHGIDPAEFPYLDRKHAGPFTFGTFGVLSPRKGIDVLIRAFSDEFTPRDDVRLLMKSVQPAEAYRVNDPRVVLVSGFLDHHGLLEFLRGLDAFVMPSRGEGFGLCGLEAMATGLPLVATNWSGPADYMDPGDSLPLSYRLVDAGGTEAHHMRFFGLWAEPDYEHLRSLLRWLYEHPEDARTKGRLASQRVHRGWTWDHAARTLLAGLDVVAGLPLAA